MGKVEKSGEKWGKVGENGEKLEKVGNSWNKWGKVGKMAKSGEKRPFWIPIFAKIDRDLPL